MKRLTQLLLTALCGLCLLPLHAQEKNDSRYLEGAVPEADGKVVFTQEFSIPGMTQDEIYNRVLKWMEARMKKNENNSRVVYTNQERGQVVGSGEEWIVFSSGALSLDRTKIRYQLNAVCQPEHCTLEVEKIRYEYREGKEKYTAEEWITDKYALNKTKTKLVRGLAKWRRKTVDFVDALDQELATALSIATTEAPAEASKAETPKAAQQGPKVIVPQQTVIREQAQPRTGKPAGDGYQEVAPDQLNANLIQMGAGRLVIVIGTDAFNMTMMTANAGGSLGKVSGKPVVFCFLSPDQPYEQLEKAESYTVRFYPTGEEQPSVMLECKKQPAQAPLEGQPRMYTGEIVKAFVKSSSDNQ